MGKRGPKKLPTNILKLRGSRRIEDRPKNEPKPIMKMPKPPDFLDGLALKEWNRKAKLLFEQGTLSLIDDSALAAYCDAYALYVEARSACRENGKFRITEKTVNKNIIQSPALSVMNRARKDMVALAAEFGMTPSGRTGINVPQIDSPQQSKSQKWISKNEGA